MSCRSVPDPPRPQTAFPRGQARMPIRRPPRRRQTGTGIAPNIWAANIDQYILGRLPPTMPMVSPRLRPNRSRPDRIGAHDFQRLAPSPGLPDAKVLVPHGRPRCMIAAPASAALKVGDVAPDFTAAGSLGGKPFTFHLADALKKGPVVLYFYPSAYTHGCDLEAHAFATEADKFAAAGATTSASRPTISSGSRNFPPTRISAPAHFPSRPTRTPRSPPPMRSM